MAMKYNKNISDHKILKIGQTNYLYNCASLNVFQTAYLPLIYLAYHIKKYKTNRNTSDSIRTHSFNWVAKIRRHKNFIVFYAVFKLILKVRDEYRT